MSTVWYREERIDETCRHHNGIFFREGLFHATVDGYATMSALIRGRIAHTSHPKHQVDLDVRRQICLHLLLSGDGAHSRSTGNYTGNQERNYIMLFLQGCYIQHNSIMIKSDAKCIGALAYTVPRLRFVRVIC